MPLNTPRAVSRVSGCPRNRVSSKLPAERARDLLELEVLTTLCQQVNANTFAAAFAGREALVGYKRAIELARTLGDPARLYTAITELCNYHMIIAQYDLSTELLDELEQLERDHALDPALLHSGIFARAYIAFYRAELPVALRLLARLAPSGHESSEFREPGGRALALGHLACVRWVMGDPERALAEADETIRLAEASNSQILIALGQVVRARLRYLRRDPLATVEADAQAAMQAAALDLGLHTEASAFALWARAQHSPLELSEIEPLLSSLRQRLQEVSTCSTLVGHVLIHTLSSSGHLAEAEKLTDEIIAFAQAHNESVYLPELLRTRGEQLAKSDPSEAKQAFHQAIELARASGARSLELRASTSLAALTAP